jgi:hypothetical protein
VGHSLKTVVLGVTDLRHPRHDLVSRAWGWGCGSVDAVRRLHSTAKWAAVHDRTAGIVRGCQRGSRDGGAASTCVEIRGTIRPRLWGEMLTAWGMYGAHSL